MINLNKNKKGVKPYFYTSPGVTDDESTLGCGIAVKSSPVNASAFVVSWNLYPVALSFFVTASGSVANPRWKRPFTPYSYSYSSIPLASAFNSNLLWKPWKYFALNLVASPFLPGI